MTSNTVSRVAFLASPDESSMSRALSGERVDENVALLCRRRRVLFHRLRRLLQRAVWRLAARGDACLERALHVRIRQVEAALYATEAAISRLAHPHPHHEE